MFVRNRFFPESPCGEGPLFSLALITNAIVPPPAQEPLHQYHATECRRMPRHRMSPNIIETIEMPDTKIDFDTWAIPKKGSSQ